MKKITEMYVWIAPADDPPEREIIPMVVLEDGRSQIQLCYSNGGPDGYGAMLDSYAVRASRKFGKPMRLVRFDSRGATVVKRLRGGEEV